MNMVIIYIQVVVKLRSWLELTSSFYSLTWVRWGQLLCLWSLQGWSTGKEGPSSKEGLQVFFINFSSYPSLLLEKSSIFVWLVDQAMSVFFNSLLEFTEARGFKSELLLLQKKLWIQEGTPIKGRLKWMEAHSCRILGNIRPCLRTQSPQWHASLEGPVSWCWVLKVP